MAKDYYMIQMNDLEAADYLKTMSTNDLRSIGNEVAWLIRQEWERRQVEAKETPVESTLFDKE